MLRLSVKEHDRLTMLHAIERRERTLTEAARMLGLSSRQMRRVVRRYEREGERAVIHAARGRAPNNRTPDDVRSHVLERAREPAFVDFGPTLLAEKLAEDPAIGSLNPHTLRRWMIAEGLWQPRCRKKRHRQSRPRRTARGAMTLVDTSIHRWLEDRYPEPFALIASIDDATNDVRGTFVEKDTGEDNRRFLVDYLLTWGRPGAIYVDQASHFGNARRRVVSYSEPNATAREPEPTTSVIQRALAALDVELIFAFSPQAKGRVERLFGSFQDRLVKEMRLEGIDSIEDANRFLEEFLPLWNHRFTVEPAEPHDAHRPLPEGVDLLALFAETETRVVANDFTLKYHRVKLQITARDAGEIQPGDRIIVEERLDRSTRFRHADRYIEPVPVRPAPPPAPRKAAPAPRPVRPAADHPWRRTIKPHVVGRAPA